VKAFAEASMRLHFSAAVSAAISCVAGGAVFPSTSAYSENASSSEIAASSAAISSFLGNVVAGVTGAFAGSKLVGAVGTVTSGGPWRRVAAVAVGWDCVTGLDCLVLVLEMVMIVASFEQRADRCRPPRPSRRPTRTLIKERSRDRVFVTALGRFSKKVCKLATSR